MENFKPTVDAALNRLVTSEPRVPGVVAMATDRQRNIYEGAAGKRRLDRDADMTTDTVFAIFSTTKAITGTAALQLVEEGKLDLDAPAKNYAPDIGKLEVIEGFTESGEPKLRPPKRDVTTRMLLTHSAGMGYDFFNEKYNRLAQEKGQPSVITSSKKALMTPLLFDPGDRWEYGSNIDWCGQVIEGITGKRLGEVFKTRIFEPLGMRDSTFELTDALRQRTAGMHARNADGSLAPMDFELPSQPEVHMGGHGLYSTVGDYMRFIRMWLNDGAGEHGRVLKAETVQMAEKNHLGDKKVTMLPGVIPSLSNDAEFFPGLSKSWALTFMVNDEEAPTGRPAGALGWAGLANLFYWIDRKNGFGGFWATQILPFGRSRVVRRVYRVRNRAVQQLAAAEGGLKIRDSSTAALSGGRLRSVRPLAFDRIRVAVGDDPLTSTPVKLIGDLVPGPNAALSERIFRAAVLWSRVNIKSPGWSNFAVRAFSPLAGSSGVRDALDCQSPRSGAGRGRANVASRSFARTSAPFRREEGVQSGGVRRLHRPGRRRAHQFLPRSGRAVRRPRDHDDRGPRRPRRAPSSAAGVRRT